MPATLHRRLALAHGLLHQAPFRHPSLAPAAPEPPPDRAAEADTTFLPEFSPDFSENRSDISLQGIRRGATRAGGQVKPTLGH